MNSNTSFYVVIYYVIKHIFERVIISDVNDVNQNRY